MWRCASLRRGRPALGTLVEVRVEGAEAEAAAAAIDAAFATIAQVERLMSFHDPASELSALNARAHREPVRVHPWTWSVLEAALGFWRRTRGLFACTVAPLLARAGYLPARGVARMPCDAMDGIELIEGHAVRFKRALAIDLGGIAKGFAVDRAVERLLAHGIRQGAVNAGGDLRLFGPRPEPVLVRDPGDPQRLVKLGDFAQLAVATSAGYFSRRRFAGREVTPIADPRRAVLVDSDFSASVIAPDCMTADALTKPLFLTSDPELACFAACGARARIVPAQYA